MEHTLTSCFFGCVLFALSASAADAPNTLVLATNGVAKARIVLPARANMAEDFAAEELKHHLELATGAKFGIFREDTLTPSWRSGGHIYLGATKAAEKAGVTLKGFEAEEHVGKLIGGDLYLRGVDRNGYNLRNHWSSPLNGTLWAVYAFLENELHAKWLWPGETGIVLDRRPYIKLNAYSYRHKEPLDIHFVNIVESRHAEGFMGWTYKKNADKYDETLMTFLVRQRNGNKNHGTVGHAFTDWWRRYGKKHPDFFALRSGGERGPLEGNESGSYLTMCVSNPEFHKKIVEEWWNGSTRKPGNIPYAPYVNCCENDSPAMCTCARCRSWDAPDPRFETHPYWTGKVTINKSRGRFRLGVVDWGEGDNKKVTIDPPSLTDRYVKFYNTILDMAREKDPNAHVLGYAYANYKAAPVRERLKDGIVINFVPGMWFPYSKADSEVYRHDWAAWRKAGATRMRYRPNYMLAGGNCPVNMARRFVSDFNFAWTNGMTECYFDSLTGTMSAQAMQNYALLRMCREPGITYERLEDEFCSAFGAAAEDIRAYWRRVEKVGAGLDKDSFRKIGEANRSPNTGTPGGYNAQAVLVIADLYSEDFFAECFGYLGAAKRKLAGDDASVARVEYLEKGLRDALLTYRTRVAQKTGDKAAFASAFKTMRAHRTAIEGDCICNYYYQGNRERNAAAWPYSWSEAK